MYDRQLLADLFGPRRTWLIGPSLRCGDHVAVKGRDGAWTVLAHGDHSALVEHLWSRERLRVPLDLLTRA